MDANLMKYFGLCIFMWSCLTPLAAWGDALPDPTRPPAGIDGSALGYSQGAYPPVRGLQTVIISPAHCAAIIDGKTVKLGARHGNERLVEVSERGVVMQGESGRRKLILFPAVAMKIAGAPAQGGQPAMCKFEQNKRVKEPAKQAGQKEKK
jgi:hypothetical protein